MSTLADLIREIVPDTHTTKHYRSSALGFGHIIGGDEPVIIGDRFGSRGSTASIFATSPAVFGGSEGNRCGSCSTSSCSEHVDVCSPQHDNDGDTPMANPPKVAKVYRNHEEDYGFYKNEIKILSMLGSVPNTITPAIFGTGVITTMRDGYEMCLHPWILMEHCGVSLSSLIDGPLDRKVAMNYIRQICAGLAFLHKTGIVHCDINPGNIMVKDGGIKIIDFGAAAPCGSGFLKRPGSVEYQAPEVKCAGDYGPPCDMWSAGVTFFKMLTGIVPFDYTGDYDVIYSVDEGMDGQESDDSTAGGSEMSAESGESASEDPIPEDIVAESVEHLKIIYTVVPAPEVQLDEYNVQPVPIPIGISALILLNTELELADAWFISELVSPLFHINPAERPTADSMLKN